MRHFNEAIPAHRKRETGGDQPQACTLNICLARTGSINDASCFGRVKLIRVKSTPCQLYPPARRLVSDWLSSCPMTTPCQLYPPAARFRLIGPMTSFWWSGVYDAPTRQLVKEPALNLPELARSLHAILLKRRLAYLEFLAGYEVTNGFSSAVFKKVARMESRSSVVWMTIFRAIFELNKRFGSFLEVSYLFSVKWWTCSQTFSLFFSRFRLGWPVWKAASVLPTLLYPIPALYPRGKVR